MSPMAAAWPKVLVQKHVTWLICQFWPAAYATGEPILKYSICYKYYDQSSQVKCQLEQLIHYRIFDVSDSSVITCMSVHLKHTEGVIVFCKVPSLVKLRSRTLDPEVLPSLMCQNAWEEEASSPEEPKERSDIIFNYPSQALTAFSKQESRHC